MEGIVIQRTVVHFGEEMRGRTGTKVVNCKATVMVQGRDAEARSKVSGNAGARDRRECICSQAWRCRPIILAVWEVEAGRS